MRFQTLMALLERCRERTQAIEGRLIEGLSPEQGRIIRRWLVEVATRDLDT